MIRNVVLDIGNVLASFRWKDLMQDLGFSESTIADLKTGMIQSPLWGELDRGVMRDAAVVEEIKRQNQKYIKEITLFFEHVADLVEQYPYTESFIRELKKQGLKVYILSNYPAFTFEIHKKEKYTFPSMVDGMVVSGYVKMIKPDKEIYEYLFTKYDLLPEECVFIDDKPENIQGSVNAGMKGILFQSYEQAVEELQRIIG